MATAYTDQVQKVYIAYYGRAADPVGLAYWAAKVETDGLAGIMASFGASAEATTLYGSLTNTAKVNALYQQSFGRDADFAGLMYYAGQLTAGTMTAVTIAQNIFDGASGSDATILANKLIVAKAYTTAVDTASEVVAYAGTVAAASARALLTTVDAATVTASFDVATSVASIVSVANATPAVAGTTTALTATTDTAVGGAGADIFNSVIQAAGVTGSTIAPGDTISGGEGVDTLAISVAGALASAAYTLSAVSTTDVEKVLLSNFDTNNTNANIIDASLMTGVTHVGLSSSSIEGDTTFDSVKNLVAAEMNNGGANLTLTYATAVVAGTADAQTLNVSNLTGGSFSSNGIEALTINGSLVKSTLAGITDTSLKSLTLTGDQDLTITAATTFAVLTDSKVIASTIDASAMTGKASVLVGDTSTVKVTGGSAADTLNLAGTLETNDVIDGGDGVDTLTMTSAVLTTQFTNVSNVETVAFNTSVGAAFAANKLSTGVTNIRLDSTDQTDGNSASAATVTGLDGETVTIRHTKSDDGTDTNGDGNTYAITNALDTIDDTVNVVFDGIGTQSGTAEISFGVLSLDVTSFETVNIESAKNTAGTFQTNGSTAVSAIGAVVLNTLETLTVSGTTKTVNLTGAAALTITDIAGSVMTSLDASAMTGAFIGTLSVADDLTVKLPATVSSTINFAGFLNNKDSVTGGTGTADVVTATATGLLASTGALTISAVEKVNLTTSGNNTLNLAGITGATTVAVTDNIQTITGLDLATSITLGLAGDASATASEIDVTAADSTGSSDTLKVVIENTAGSTTSIIDASGIETLALTQVHATNNSTLDLTTFDGASITLDAKTGVTVSTGEAALGTLNKNTNSLTSTFLGDLGASFANSTAPITFTGNGKSVQTITGSGFADTFNIGSTKDLTHVIAGGAGEDTINYTSAVDATAEFGSISAIQTFNLVVASAANVTVTSGVFHADVDDITVTGGNSTSTFTTGALASTVETLDASAFKGNFLATVAADALDTTVIFTGGALTTDKVSNTVTTAATTYALKSTGVELLALDVNGAGSTTVSLAAATGVTGVSVDLAASVIAAVTISNVGSEIITIENAAGGNDTVEATLVSSTGSADTVAFKSGASNAAGLKIKTTDIETVTINNDNATSYNLSTLTMTAAGATMALTVTGDTAMTISALDTDVNTIDASGMAVGGSVIQTGRTSTAASTYTGSDGNDTLMMKSKGDVLTGGAGTDTLDIDFTGILGGVSVNLSSTTDQVDSMDGSTNTAIQLGFENVDASGFTGFGASITGTAKANSITGSPLTDSIVSGAGVDTVTATAGNDVIDLGDGNDTLEMSTTLVEARSGGGVTDSYAGGAGTDILKILQVTTGLVDADLDLLTSVEHLSLFAGINTVALGAEAIAGGIITVTGAPTHVDTINATKAFAEQAGLTINFGVTGTDVLSIATVGVVDLSGATDIKLTDSLTVAADGGADAIKWANDSFDDGSTSTALLLTITSGTDAHDDTVTIVSGSTAWDASASSVAAPGDWQLVNTHANQGVLNYWNEAGATKVVVTIAALDAGAVAISGTSLTWTA